MYFSSFCSWSLVSQSACELRTANTYILPDDRSETRAPQNTLTTDLVHKQPLAREHGFRNTLTLVLGHNALRACEKGVLAHAPLLVASKLNDCDVADRRGREKELTWARVVRFRHFAANERFLE